MQRVLKQVLSLLFLFLSVFLFLTCRPFIAGGIEHEVKPGHTLVSIARVYPSTVEDIKRANNLSNSTIYPGQKLFIPNALRKRYVQPPLGARVHIRERTSLKELARRYNMSEDFLHQANQYPFWKSSVRNEEVFIPGLVKPEGTEVLASSPSTPVGSPPSSLPFSLIWPVEGRITSRFQSDSRPDHSGLDIAAPRGTPIKAAADGRVVYSDNRISGYGNMVILEHKEGFFTVYSHNQRNAVRPGQQVQQGETIGYIGMTGRATGPHLHFEIRHHDTPLDPEKHLP